MIPVKKITKCRVCKSTGLYKFLDLGQMPIPNGFLTKETLKKKEEKYNLACFYCNSCGLVQLTHVVNPNIMFKNYVYIPSTAKIMMNNFSNLAFAVHKRFKLGNKDLVVDIGSNDGSLLTFFKSFQSKVLGIDPAINLAKVAELKGVPTMTSLFNSKVALKAVKKFGKATAITATNAIAHIHNLHEVFKGVDILLSKNGVFVTEFPYLYDLVSKNQFDTIYHEHLSYFSLKPWVHLVEKFDFEIIDVKRLLIHGGSLRLTHRRKSGKAKHHIKSVRYLTNLEKELGLHEKQTYNDFSLRILALKKDLKKYLTDLKKANKKIVGYGAAAKGNVLTNFFNIGTETLDYIVDSVPYKQGLYTPGKHIPIFSEHKIVEDQPDYALILAWNFADEIIEKQKEFLKKGGRFIIPVPSVRTI